MDYKTKEKFLEALADVGRMEVVKGVNNEVENTKKEEKSLQKTDG